MGLFGTQDRRDTCLIFGTTLDWDGHDLSGTKMHFCAFVPPKEVEQKQGRWDKSGKLLN